MTVVEVVNDDDNNNNNGKSLVVISMYTKCIEKKPFTCKSFNQRY